MDTDAVTNQTTRWSGRTDTQVKKEQLQGAKFEKKLQKASKGTIGFTNKLAIGLVAIMIMTIFMGFALAIYSIHSQYTGALACFTICVTPLDTCLGVVLCKVVDKSKAENLGADGTGIAYAAAQAKNFVIPTFNGSINSPAI